ncbi:hypothetical protein DFJ77DRAFT_514441 [Powellomyces hirtus]|nr:hypothetical protein DFJ77DRAFT_514441 [Powellomyces hirtus]
MGSRAAKYWMPPFRPPWDWSVIALVDDFRTWIDGGVTENSMELVYYPIGDLTTQGDKLCPGLMKLHCDIVYRSSDCDNAVFDIEIVTSAMDNDVVRTFVNVNSTEVVKKTRSAAKSSAQRLLEYCAPSEETIALPRNGMTCKVASFEVLEALKHSHIFWPAHFHKHIADLHFLRALIPSDSHGRRVRKDCPMTSPTRDVTLEEILQLRYKEAKAFRGVPADHINLTMTNEEFLDQDDDLFVERHKERSKSMVSREFFMTAAYDKQLLPLCIGEDMHDIDQRLVPKVCCGSWGGEDIWNSTLIKVKPLDKPGCSLVSKSNGKTPFKNEVNEAKVDGDLPVQQQKHLWSDLWTLRFGGKIGAG